MPTQKDKQSWYAYIVESGEGQKRKIGSTPSLKGAGGLRGMRPPTMWKKLKPPVNLVYAEEFSDQTSAENKAEAIMNSSHDEQDALLKIKANLIQDRVVRVF